VGDASRVAANGTDTAGARYVANCSDVIAIMIRYKSVVVPELTTRMTNHSLSRFAAGVALCVAAACAKNTTLPSTTAPASLPIATTSDELVRLMHDRYDGKWYRTLTFVQKNSRYLANGTADTSTWYEAMRIPGGLRIDIAPLAQKNGILFVRDSRFVIGGGRVTNAVASVHPLLVLASDVYADTPERTLQRLKTLGFDLSKMHDATWQGRPVYVVGAAQGDLRHRQFWIDRERLVFVRMLQPDRDTTKVSEIQFNDYRPMGKGWVAPEVVFLTDGKRTFVERYEELRADVELADDTFNPRAWNTVPHWRTTP
jgi:hypothetical protein